jgi:hypothetical protein
LCGSISLGVIRFFEEEEKKEKERKKSRMLS